MAAREGDDRSFEQEGPLAKIWGVAGSTRSEDTTNCLDVHLHTVQLLAFRTLTSAATSLSAPPTRHQPAALWGHALGYGALTEVNLVAMPVTRTLECDHGAGCFDGVLSAVDAWIVHG
jgi:hypothetical protein